MPGIFGSSSLAATARTSGTSSHQRRPPRRPVRGLRGARSQRASLITDQRSEPCSRRMADHDEDELPDHAGGQAEQDGLRPGARTLEDPGQPGSDDPRQRGHRQGGCGPGAEDPTTGVLRDRQLHGSGGSRCGEEPSARVARWVLRVDVVMDVTLEAAVGRARRRKAATVLRPAGERRSYLVRTRAGPSRSLRWPREPVARPSGRPGRGCGDRDHRARRSRRHVGPARPRPAGQRSPGRPRGGGRRGDDPRPAAASSGAVRRAGGHVVGQRGTVFPGRPLDRGPGGDLHLRA